MDWKPNELLPLRGTKDCVNGYPRYWLESERFTNVVLESLGLYWKPVLDILEEGMKGILVIARKIKNVPGWKTDLKDCEWMVQLLHHDLIKGSFIPSKHNSELRPLVHYRQKLIQQKSFESTYKK